MDTKTLFSGKAQFYNSRPTYPIECITYLINKFSLNPDSVIADIGAGTFSVNILKTVLRSYILQ